MVQLSSDRLPKLPREVKDLVAAGVYSLFALTGFKRVPQATHVLLAKGDEIYLLDAEGGLLPASGVTLAELTLAEAVGFDDVDTGPVLKINCA